MSAKTTGFCILHSFMIELAQWLFDHDNTVRLNVQYHLSDSDLLCIGPNNIVPEIIFIRNHSYDCVLLMQQMITNKTKQLTSTISSSD